MERSGEAAVVPFYEKLSLYCGAQSVFSILRASGGEKQISGVCSLAEGATQDSSPQEEIEYQELRHLIDATLARMPERRLRIFRMHRMEGKKYAEIASQLSLSVKTVEAEMTKALKALKKEIENYIIRT